MAVRSAMPWPFRWALVAIVLGFCAAIGLWAFEFGKEIAGLEHGTKELARIRLELSEVQSELAKTRQERDQAQSIANTADTLVTTEKASHEKLIGQIKQLESDNRTLRDDLGFFEKLIPAAGVEGVAIRGLQTEMLGPNKVKWQVLVIQANKNAAEFNGKLELVFAGITGGKMWTLPMPAGPQTIKIRQYGRIEGEFELPQQATLRSVTARVLDGSVVKATQSTKL
jgi:hypothetical protein